MRIFIVEDNQIELEAVTSIISLWISKKKRNDLDSVHTIMSQDAFHDQIKSVMQADVIFFDIQLSDSEESAGLILAEKLRSRGYTGYIVFLTSHSEFSFQGYDVQAFQFLVKPVTSVKLIEIMNLLFSKIEAKRTFQFVEEKRTKIILTDTICYFASNKRKIEIHTINSGNVKTTYSYLGKISDLEKRLSFYPFFVKAHRGHYVNVLHIQKIIALEMHLSNGEILPLAKNHYETVVEAFANYTT